VELGARQLHAADAVLLIIQGNCKACTQRHSPLRTFA